MRKADATIPVMIHLDNGGNNALYREWFDNFTKRGEDFEIIGLSYYPFWHGSLQMLNDNMNDIAERYGKDLVIAEVSMGYTMEDYKNYEKLSDEERKGYAGGPKVDKLSKEGNPNAIEFPKAKIGDCPYDFSFSGVKSAVLNYINHAQMTGEEINRADLAASFQKAVVDVLVEHTMLAAKDYGMTKIAIAGGVASNGTLRAAMEEACKKNNYSFYRPSPIFCTDNAAMIGVAAYYEYIKGTRHGWDLNAVPNLKLGER